jgi:hypothetical protein
MMQPSLLDWVPPVVLGDRDGETFDRKRDLSRLNDQMRDVYRLMQDGQWRPLFAIAHHTGHPEASVSARLRDLRKPRYGGFTVERRYIANGVFHYRLVIE